MGESRLSRIVAKADSPDVPIQHQKFTLYWSSLDLYEKCPQRFLWSRGWGNIDVGGGPGKRKPLPEKTSDHHRVMGNTIAKVSEYRYNGTEDAKFPSTTEDGKPHPQAGKNIPWWMLYKGSELVERLEKATEREFDYYCDKPKTYIPFGGFNKGRVPTRSELLNVCLEGVRGYLKTMVANKLVGQYAFAEVNLLGYINEDNPIGGRADLLLRREEGVVILDGKNSAHKGRHTDPNQLVWYALCFYVAYGRLPEKLGFIYYRYPYDPATDETGVEWVEFDPGDVKGLAVRAVEARAAMYRHEFDPVPTPDVCRYCDFESICPERQQQKAKNSKKRRESKKKKLERDLSGSNPLKEGAALLELDFGQ